MENPVDKDTELIETLRAQLKTQRRTITHLKRDLKKAKCRIHTLKGQKEKLHAKLKPAPKLPVKAKQGFFK